MRKLAMTGMLLVAMLGCALPVAADINIPAGASVELRGGSILMAGTDMSIGGQLALGSGAILDTGSFSTLASGTTHLDAGLVVLSGDWSNAGTITPGSSRVEFIDGTNAASQVLGASAFHAISFVSTTGKHYAFEAGATQNIATGLVIQGTAAKPIQFQSTAAPQVAYINLASGGNQSIAHVGVSNVHASGQHLAPNQHNEGGSGNDLGWFGHTALPPFVPVPATSRWAMLLLSLLLVLLALRQAGRPARRQRPDSTTIAASPVLLSCRYPSCQHRRPAPPA